MKGLESSARAALPKAGWKKGVPGREWELGGGRGEEKGKGEESPVKGFHLDAGLRGKPLMLAEKQMSGLPGC